VALGSAWRAPRSSTIRLRTRLLLALAYVLLLAIVALEIPLALSLRDRVDAEVRSQAEGQAAVVAASAADLLAPAANAGLVRLAESSAAPVRGRVLVLDARGRVLADSAHAAARGTSYVGRPEVRAALRGNRLQRVRHSSSLGADILATAAPIVRGGRVAGAVRVTQSVTSVHHAVRRTIVALVLVGATVLLVGLAAGALIAAQIARPLKRLERAARRVADGDLEARAIEEGSMEQRSVARSFNEMTARLTSLLAAQRRFVADASHQLRTPLTGLKLRLDALGNGASPTDLDEASAEVDRLARIVDELLSLSRAGETSAAVARCDLAAAAQAAARRFDDAAAARGIVVRAADQVVPAFGWCVRSELDRALDALVENAIAYAADGGEVEIAAAPGLVEVRDRGPGPAAGEEELLFERFHRGSRASGAAPGTGLGLSIARALARGWGGDATLRARPGGGAVAALVVPREHRRQEVVA
jgi:two-component system, OmpR family, sensor kinase